MLMNANFQAIILAAGRGSRMGGGVPKVLVPLCGRPIIEYILDTLREVGITKPITVTAKDSVIQETLGDMSLYAVQETSLGSGHAVMCARETARGAENILVMCGDSPLFLTRTVRLMMESHLSERAAVTLATSVLANPAGYGRILRDPAGRVCGIVEEKMATEEKRTIREINGGCYAFNAEWLWKNIDLLSRNDAGEYCLTEMVGIALTQRRRVITVPCSPDEVLGINTPEQLAEAEEALQHLQA